MNLYICVLFVTCAVAENIGVEHLMGEPDYRQVTLRWEARSDTPDTPSNSSNALEAPGEVAVSNFQIRYCELQAWGAQRCRARQVPEVAHVSQTPGDDRGARFYTVDVDGLRMATTYSFEVRRAKAGRDDRSDGNDNKIIVPTKGFSAKATRCLPHASEIEVSTGPYFAGRIAVEAADGERCAVDGQPQNAQDTYVLRINHKECGSYVNKTTVATYVLVQENLPILTHSTRRFLVLCTYQPETLTVRAGLSLPSGVGHGQSAAVPYDHEYKFQSRSSRHLRPAKLQATDGAHHVQDSSSPVAIISLLIVAGVCCMTLAVYRWHRRRVEASLDNISIASSVDTVSNADNIDLDNVSVISNNTALRNECPPTQTRNSNRY